MLHRLEQLAVLVAVGDHLRAADAELEALAAHLLDEDREVQLAAAGDLDPVRPPQVLHAERDVGAQLALQPVLDLAQGGRAAVPAGERPVVDEEEHADRGLLDLERRQGHGGRAPLRLDESRRRQRVAERDVLRAGEPDDVAGGDLVDRAVVEAAGDPEVRDTRSLRPGHPPPGLRLFGLEARRGDAPQLIAHLELALEHAAAADTADIVAPGQRAHLHAERRRLVHGRRRHLADDRLEQVAHAGVGQLLEQRRGEPAAVHEALLALVFFLHILVDVLDDPALETGAVEHREVELPVVGAELDEEVEGPVQRAGRIGVRPVDLVHDHDRPQPQAEGAHQHVTRLRHGALVRVHQEEHRVDHAEYALHLSREVGVARRVDDVDEVAAPLHRAVLGADRDAALALEVAAVHDALLDPGVVAEHTGGAEDAVDQGRLAVVDVGDDGEIADRLGGVHGRSLQSVGSRTKAPGEPYGPGA